MLGTGRRNGQGQRARREPRQHRVRGLVPAVAALVGAAALALANGAGGVEAQPAQVTVDVDLTEFAVTPAVASVPAGVPVRFAAKNTGGISHQLAVTQPNAQSAVAAPGETVTLDVVFPAAGNVTLFCPIGNVPTLPGVSHRERGMAAPFTITAAPAGALQTIPTPAPAPPARALAAPGADVDRVGLPEAYRTRFPTFYVFDRSDNRQVRHVYANPVGTQVREGQPFPYGTILVMETWRAQLTADNQIALDSNGRYIKDELTGIFVMRKERGFGAKYGPDRTGEWEYVAYRPDGTGFATAPDRSQACAQCHLAASDTQKDWVVRANLFFANRPALLRGVAGLPRTGAHALATGTLPPGAIPFALAAGAPALGLAGLALRSLSRALARRW